MKINHCEHDNIEIAFKCMDCQEERMLFPDADQYMPMDEVDISDIPEEENYWPEKIDALEIL